MAYALSSEEMIQRFGLTGVTWFPQFGNRVMMPEAAEFLGSVGLPHCDWFVSQSDVAEEQRFPADLGAFLDDMGIPCSESQRSWSYLGEFAYRAYIGLDPTDGTIHAFYESEDESVLVSSSIDKFVRALNLFHELNVAYRSDRRRDSVDSFQDALREMDPTVLETPLSVWINVIEEMRDGIW